DDLALRCHAPTDPRRELGLEACEIAGPPGLSTRHRNPKDWRVRPGRRQDSQRQEDSDGEALSHHGVARPRRRIRSDRKTMTNDAATMQEPSAKTLGSWLGSRNWPQMKIGRVASLPERKKASRNSSNEVVKQSSMLATIPGMASGRVTRQ